ncbi:helix-turn-helix domain-containing protein [Streptomyces sp. B21-101]
MRLDAVVRFEAGQTTRAVATALRVSERSVERWRRQWREGGAPGVASKGSPGRSRLSDGQISRLERELERGPLAHGWADQRWTLAVVGQPLLAPGEPSSWRRPASRSTPAPARRRCPR